MANSPMKSAEIVKFLQEHPEWALQFCEGIIDAGWWWLRKIEEDEPPINVDGRLARSAIRYLKRVPAKRYGVSNYVLKE